VITAAWIEDQKELADTILALAKLRKEQGVSQIQAGEMMGTTQGVISSIEVMRHSIRIYTLMSYARTMGKRVKLVLEDLSDDEG